MEILSSLALLGLRLKIRAFEITLVNAIPRVDPLFGFAQLKKPEFLSKDIWHSPRVQPPMLLGKIPSSHKQ